MDISKSSAAAASLLLWQLRDNLKKTPLLEKKLNDNVIIITWPFSKAEKDFFSFHELSPYKTFNNVAISAAITAFGRMYLHKYIIDNNITVVYWDTDGIFTKEQLTKLVGKNLGEFRYVCSIEEIVFAAPKF